MGNCVPGAIFFPYFKSYKSIALDRTVKANESKKPVCRVSAEQNTKLFMVNNGCHCTKKGGGGGGVRSYQAAVG